MSNNNHPEWRKENTLTTPSDRDRTNQFRLDQTAPPLNIEELNQAMQALNNDAFVRRFPEVERRFVDPAIDLQKIGLISFVPAKGAIPNSEGIYGFAKLRGNYPSEIEANEQAERIIRNVDSYHQIYHTYVGRPFPLTCSSDYSREVNRVDMQKQATTAISEDIRKKREQEQKDIEDIKKREQELLEDVKKPEEKNDDHYTTLQVKKAQLTWTYVETEKKLRQMTGLIAKARREIEEMDRENPELRQLYYNKYMEARKQAGLSIEKIDSSENFIKYMVEDVKIPAIEEEYNRLYGESKTQN
jgi:hypothetical protein